jgi:hypothetical protein
MVVAFFMIFLPRGLLLWLADNNNGLREASMTGDHQRFPLRGTKFHLHRIPGKVSCSATRKSESTAILR